MNKTMEEKEQKEILKYIKKMEDEDNIQNEKRRIKMIMKKKTMKMIKIKIKKKRN